MHKNAAAGRDSRAAKDEDTLEEQAMKDDAETTPTEQSYTSSGGNGKVSNDLQCAPECAFESKGTQTDELVGRVIEGHAACRAAGETMVRHAIDVGENLIRLQELIPHGAWGSFCAERFPIKSRQLQQYQQVAREKTRVLIAMEGEDGVNSIADAVRVASGRPTPASAADSLAAAEAAIGGGVPVFGDVLDRLTAIRDQRLYRGTHGTFGEYLRDKWGAQAEATFDRATGRAAA